MSEKTLPPTPQRLRKAKEEGQVAKSKDLSLFASGISVMIAVAMGGVLFLKGIAHQFDLVFENLRSSNEISLGISLYLLRESLFYSLILCGAAALGGSASCFLQVGPIFAFKALKIDFNRVNPVESLKNLFSMCKLFELAKNIFQIVFIGAVTWIVIKGSLADLIRGLEYDLYFEAHVAWKIIVGLFAAVSIGQLVLAGGDFLFQRFQFLKKQRMSPDEVKREHRENEGSPEQKSKRKEIFHESLQELEMEQMFKAAMLVTNPTHLAIAIHYEGKPGEFPKVLMKGAEETAFAMIERARMYGIPVIQEIRIARTLFAEVKTGKRIPSHLIQPVAVLLRWARDTRAAQDQANLPQISK